MPFFFLLSTSQYDWYNRYTILHHSTKTYPKQETNANQQQEQLKNIKTKSEQMEISKPKMNKTKNLLQRYKYQVIKLTWWLKLEVVGLNFVPKQKLAN